MYRLETCTGLPDIAQLDTTSSFPVNYGEVVTVKCGPGYELAGDDVITCDSDTVFVYNTVPSCTLGDFSHFVFLLIS